MSKNDFKLLSIRAGHHARRLIRKEGGLEPARIKLMVGASGGPKWLALARLDRAILRHWIVGRTQPMDLLASSIGTWRFACYAQPDPLKALARFEESYLDYRPEKGQTADKITRDSYAILGDILGENGGTAMFQGPMRLAVMAVRGRHVLNTDRRVPLGVGLAAAALGNMAHRSALGLFFERALFADPRSDCSYTAWSGFPMRRLNLTADNLPHAIMASCSIPMLLNGITIPGAPKGLYRDGGIIDYHFDLPFFHHDPDSLVLYPHFTDRIIAGWFDKHLGWRKARAGNASNVVLVAPSAEFVSRLPYGKIPDRKDFTTLETEDRIRYWRLVLDETERLSDAFETLIETGQFAGQVQPILGEAE